MNIFEVIMAGGGGSRFWPLSREARPKQLLNLTGRDIMINETALRMEPLVSRDHVYIVTNRAQRAQMESLLLDGIDRTHILAEPAARNTAPCILYAALTLHKQWGDGVMCVLPADHYIEDTKEYRRVMARAAEVAAATGQIVTIGIAPSYAATGYGYIACADSAPDMPDVYRVEAFVEKPCVEDARAYLERGNYLWNSGVFVWKISTILKAFQEYLPDMYDALMPICELDEGDLPAFLEQVYPSLESISVDYGIMEHVSDVLTLRGDYGWSDVGSLDALTAFYPEDDNGNVLIGDVLAVDSAGSIVRGAGKLIAVVGAKDLMVIDTEDALLVCPKNRAQDVRRVAEKLKQQNRKER